MLIRILLNRLSLLEGIGLLLSRWLSSSSSCIEDRLRLWFLNSGSLLESSVGSVVVGLVLVHLIVLLLEGIDIDL